MTEGEFGGWRPVGAEQTASGYQVSWKMGGAEQYIIWQTDGVGQWPSQTAVMSGGSAALQSLEAVFHMVEIEAQGSTRLSHAADGYAMQAAGGMSDGVFLKYRGVAVTEGRFGEWKAIAAEQTATGFEVAWKMDGQDQYILWQTDAQGNWLGQTAPVSGSNATLQISESTVVQALNNDGTLELDASASVAATPDDAVQETGAEITVDLCYSAQPGWMLHG